MGCTTFLSGVLRQNVTTQRRQNSSVVMPGQSNSLKICTQTTRWPLYAGVGPSLALWSLERVVGNVRHHIQSRTRNRGHKLGTLTKWCTQRCNVATPAPAPADAIGLPMHRATNAPCDADDRSLILLIDYKGQRNQAPCRNLLHV